MLAIAKRKAGSEIDCPKCGVSQEVPNAQAAAAALAMDQVDDGQQTTVSGSEFVVYDDPVPAPSPVPISDKGSDSSVQAQNELPTAPSSVLERGKPVPRNMILYHRRTFYIHGVLFVVVGAVAFLAGYYIGHGTATEKMLAEQEKQQRQLATVEGTLEYKDSLGQTRPDQGAVIVILPEGAAPEKKLAVTDFDPSSPESEENPREIRRLLELGGFFLRADAEGHFSEDVPHGDYFLLILSNRSKRPAGSNPGELDLVKMRDFFNLPKDLIGPRDYRWLSIRASIALNPIDLTFGAERVR